MQKRELVIEEKKTKRKKRLVAREKKNERIGNIITITKGSIVATPKTYWRNHTLSVNFWTYKEKQKSWELTKKITYWRIKTEHHNQQRTMKHQGWENFKLAHRRCKVCVRAWVHTLTFLLTFTTWPSLLNCLLNTT